jgi:TatD DNase family protein
VDRLVVVGIDADWNRRAIELVERHAGVYAAVGWHPSSSASFGRDSLEGLRRMAAHPKVVAIGEIGLDLYRQPDALARQLAVLDAQMDLAEDLGMPVVFHCRNAWPHLMGYLEARKATIPLLFHCFSGETEDAHRAVALDGYFGVGGPVTYAKAGRLREILAALPRDRIVLETDAPWLAPQPHRGRPNQPAFLPLINARLAQVLGLPAAGCADLTTANAERLFRLARPAA